MIDDADLKEVLGAVKDAEGEARIDVEGHAYFNGVRYVNHPRDCDCGKTVMLLQDHCWCCGYAEGHTGCSCMRARDAGICMKCGSCTVHCFCN